MIKSLVSIVGSQTRHTSKVYTPDGWKITIYILVEWLGQVDSHVDSFCFADNDELSIWVLNAIQKSSHYHSQIIQKSVKSEEFSLNDNLPHKIIIKHNILPTASVCVQFTYYYSYNFFLRPAGELIHLFSSTMEKPYKCIVLCENAK